MQPTIEELKGISLLAATRMALAASSKTEDEIAAEMGWSQSQQARFFKSHDYWPALPNLSSLCRALGNCTIPLWIMANFEYVSDQQAPMDAKCLLMSMAVMFRDMGELAVQGQKAVEDNQIDSLEAKRMLRKLRDLFSTCYLMVPRLQATIDADK